MWAMNSYPINTLVSIDIVVKTPAGVLIDPSTLTCDVNDPSGTTTTYTYGVDITFLRNSLGNFTLEVDGNAHGMWFYHPEASGNVEVSGDGYFFIKEAYA
jgi:hypothetical protein